jgi:hypothetical protein
VWLLDQNGCLWFLTLYQDFDPGGVCLASILQRAPGAGTLRQLRSSRRSVAVELWIADGKGCVAAPSHIAITIPVLCFRVSFALDTILQDPLAVDISEDDAWTKVI